MTSRHRLAGSFIALFASTLALSACSSDDSHDQVVVTQVVTSTVEAAPQSTATEQAEPATPTATATPTSAALTPVEASEFSGFGAYSFDFHIGGPATGFCVIVTPGDSVTCSGTADDSVPDVEGLFSGRPNAVTLNEAGTAYTVSEGPPPPPRDLNTGEQVTLGSVTCSKPTDDVLTCELGSRAIRVEGPDRRITTS